MKHRKGMALLLTALLLAGGAFAGLFLYGRYFGKAPHPSEKLYPVRGVDLSAHNGAVDFDVLGGQGIAFAYLKATEGTDFIDRYFIDNARRALRSGLPCGAYHFFRFDTDGELQALNFNDALRGRDFALPPAIDIEEWGNPDGHATASIVERLRRMIQTLERLGHSPILYTNKDGYYRFVRGNFDNYPLWICSFTDPPLEGARSSWVFWQYSHRGRLEGVEGTVDLDVFAGSEEEFERFLVAK
ncbi:MAG: lysozyme [[Clostridium] fimetarium]|nr:hypothetical protein [Alistipes timonensis]MCM1405042.1 lysozyme [[Clostridium] fimetarium]